MAGGKIDLEAATYLSLVGTGAVQTIEGRFSTFDTDQVRFDTTQQTFDETSQDTDFKLINKTIMRSNHGTTNC